MKTSQLGMNYGTASSRLKRAIMWDLITRLNLTLCFRCNKLMTVDTYSIDHKNPWLHINPALFWDLNNIAFSHLTCNTKYRRMPAIVHAKGRYNKGCRCDICKAANTKARAEYRKRTGKR